MASEYIKSRFPCCVCKAEFSRRNIINSNYTILPDKEYVCHNCYAKELEKLEEIVDNITGNHPDFFSQEEWDDYHYQLEKLKGWLY